MKKKDLFYDAIVIEDVNAWVFSNEFNGLFQINLNTDQVVLLGIVPTEELKQHSLYYNMVKVGNKIILIPLKARMIAIFDLKEREFSFLPKSSQCDTFLAGAVYKNKVFLLGHNNPLILAIDIESSNVSYVYDCEEWIRKREIIPDRIYFRKNNTVIGSSFYFAFCNDNVVGRLDMENETVSFFEIPECDNGLRSLCYDGSTFWISEWNRAAVIQWDEQKGVMGRYFYPPYKVKDFRTADMFFTDRLWMFPTIGDDVLTFKSSTKEWGFVSELVPYGSDAKGHLCPNKGQSFPVVLLQKDIFYIFAGNSMELLRYSYKEKTIEAHRIMVDWGGLVDHYFQNTVSTKMYLEGKELTLEDFIEGVKGKITGI